MTPRTLIGVAEVPGGAPLSLYARGDDFTIVLDRNELMSTRMRGSEEALATLACTAVQAVAAPRLLIGGYGMGFTLRAALAVLGRAAEVTVAELVPGVIEWARGPMEALTAGCLDDPRVTLVERDVAAVIGERAGGFHAILLDVDNGPDGLTRGANDRLYSAHGLAAAHAALVPGGVLAVWSAAPDARFVRRLREARFAVEEVVVRARANGKGPRHVIWLATRR